MNNILLEKIIQKNFNKYNDNKIKLIKDKINKYIKNDIIRLDNPNIKQKCCNCNKIAIYLYKNEKNLCWYHTATLSK